MKIRPATADDKYEFVELTIRLSQFNRSNHLENSKYDDFRDVLIAIREKAKETFEHRDENVRIIVVEYKKKLIGYALGKIDIEDESADNGTGMIGLFDDIYIDPEARGHGLGQKLLHEMMIWFKSKRINRVKLHAYSWNLKAKELYEKNGFNEYAVSYEKFIFEQ
jgi:GNAT superfamily N-acetyltransferase